MSILVINCFHWVGFHVVNGLLEDGQEVDGVDFHPSDEIEHLALFFGRNSLFQQVKIDKRKEYDTTIMIGNAEGLDNVNSKRFIIINGKDEIKKGNDSSFTNIIVPLLFGEWMPMDHRGIYDNGQYISFDSHLFLTQAIYIDHFVQELLKLLRIPDLPSSLNILSRHHEQNMNKRLENTVFLHDNTSIKEKIKSVVTHYEKFKHLYSK